MRQIDLFNDVLHSYAGPPGSTLSNKSLYEQVANRAGIDPDEFAARVPVGKSGQMHSLLKRRVRWHQQNLRNAGIIERVEEERGIWKLTSPAGDELNRINNGVAVIGFSTFLGVAILGACETVFAKIDAPIVLCLTSPPYALAKQRQYGNVPESVYVDWIVRTLEPVVKNLVDGGSICLNVSNSPA